MAQVPVRVAGNKQCPYHKSDVVLSCTDCGGELVCIECTTSTHQRHAFVKLADVIPTIKNTILEFIRKSENKDLPKIKEKIDLIEERIQENSDNIENVIQEIQSHGEKVKGEINRIIEKLIEKCKAIGKVHAKRLNACQQNIQFQYASVCKRVAKCKEELDKGDSVELIDLQKSIQADLDEYHVPEIQCVDFIARKLPAKEDALGTLTIQGESYTQETGDVLTYRNNHFKVLSEFKTEYLIDRVAKTSPDSVWISYYKGKSISLFNRNGEILQNIEMKEIVNGISASPITGNLWISVAYDSNVYELVGKTPKKRFISDYGCAFCLCVTAADTVIVCTRKAITVYTKKGRMLYTNRSEIVCAFHVIESSSSNGDIAVCDTDDAADGGRDKPNVTAFTSKLRVKFQYYGHPTLRHCPTTVSASRPFNAEYDSQGRLLIADIGTSCIQLVSREGDFLTFIYSDPEKPAALTLLGDNVILAGFEDQTVKVIEYLL